MKISKHDCIQADALYIYAKYVQTIFTSEIDN